jgi:nucleoside 2-deoxyribosyltransferase
MARTNRIFTSFAIEDKWAKEYLVGQSKNGQTPFSFIDLSIKEPFDEKWKTQCRSVIKGCDGVIALLSKNTAKADGAKWEMQCAIEEGVPIIGVHTDSKNKGAIPSELAGKKVIEWSWDGIKKFLDSL